MVITNFVFPRRDAALAIGDYNSYRIQLTRQLSSLRKKLGRSTPKHAKFNPKATVTAEDIGKNHEFVYLLLLSSERAWAHAMHMRSSHAEDQANGRITGSTRSHILSRLNKASKVAEKLMELLRDRDAAHTSELDLLEAEAYFFVLRGAEYFEKDHISEDGSINSWKSCLEENSAARVLYQSLLHDTKMELFKEVLAGTVDPSIRYAAYRLRISRTIPIANIAMRYFPKNRLDLTSRVSKLDPKALSEEKANKDGAISEDIPNNIAWRSRTANIADASIGQGLAAVETAAAHLDSFLSSPESKQRSRQDRAAAYDDVLIASQDTVDVTRRAIEELEREGVAEGDPRMQDLRVTDLAVNYALVGWRIGRYRILMGSDDGLSLPNEEPRFPTQSPNDGKDWRQRPESKGRKLARLRERVSLFDSILQSIDSIKELRGAARDAGFMKELEAQRSYFRALRCLNIAYSHELDAAHAEALALTARAHELLRGSASVLSKLAPAKRGPTTMDIPNDSFHNAEKTVGLLLQRYQAIVDLRQRSLESAQAFEKNQVFLPPLVQRVTEYPPLGAKLDLSHLVNYPPKLRPIPVKPIFLDVAWNYVDYPGRSKVEIANGSAKVSAQVAARTEEQKPAKKGWFGFGR
ncbi:putative signal recognition particle [Viridothelium virens]|uniref:Signal recognition particle subunit SRP68 n=1 Tax=Viridothelium virens TaxID=1048519 RepID=A0A6A6GZN8_VIRVR|nr:putative signal recognition particle [Viridothelium virens]